MSVQFWPHRKREDAEAALLGRIIPAMVGNLMRGRRRGKTDWRLERLSDLIEHLESEVAELKAEVAKGQRTSAERVWSEAADVALLAAMVADTRIL